MKKLLIIALAAGLAGSAFALDHTWVSAAVGGSLTDAADGNSWTTDFVNPAGAVPGVLDNARVQAYSWLPAYPTLSGSLDVGGLYMGLDNGHTEGTATLDITATGSLRTNSDDGWNDGIQIGWYSAAILTSAGTVDTTEGGGWTTLGAGSALPNGWGDATLNITGGSWTTDTLSYNINSANHVQLDGGTMTLTAGIGGLDAGGQSMDITGGTLLATGDLTAYFNWIRDTGANGGVLTGYGVSANVITSYDVGSNTTTVTAIPEPATLGMLALLGGGMLWIRKRFMI